MELFGDDEIDEDSRRVYLFGCDLAHLLHVGDLGDYQVGCRCHERVEVLRRTAIDEVTRLVAAAGADQGNIRMERFLEQIILTVDVDDLFAFGYDGSQAGGRQNAAKAVACRTNPLGKGTLRAELDLQFALVVLLARCGVGTDV